MSGDKGHVSASRKKCHIWKVFFFVIIVSADKTSVVSADKTPVVSADKTSVVSLCQQTSPKTSPPTFPTQGRPRSGRPCVRNAKGDVLGDVF